MGGFQEDFNKLGSKNLKDNEYNSVCEESSESEELEFVDESETNGLNFKVDPYKNENYVAGRSEGITSNTNLQDDENTASTLQNEGYIIKTKNIVKDMTKLDKKCVLPEVGLKKRDLERIKRKSIEESDDDSISFSLNKSSRCIMESDNDYR